MDYIKIKSSFRTNEYGEIESCMLCTEDHFTMGDVSRIRKTIEDCKEASDFDDETFDEFAERVVRTHNEKHGTKFEIAFPSYEVGI